MARRYAADAQRYATGHELARLALRGEARATARMGASNANATLAAIDRAAKAMPSTPTQPGSSSWTWSFTPAAFHLYSGMTYLWLGDARSAEQHSRKALSLYEAAPPLLRAPRNEAQARLNVALSLIDQDPEEPCGFANAALGLDTKTAPESNWRQALEFKAAPARGTARGGASAAALGRGRAATPQGSSPTRRPRAATGNPASPHATRPMSPARPTPAPSAH